MRILSLVPAATEMVAALGAADSLVGISHACDFPPAVQHLPRLTGTPLDLSRSSAGIDAEVRQQHDAGGAVIQVDAEQLRALRPDLVLTQALCRVCAADGQWVEDLGSYLDYQPTVLQLRGTTLAGVEEDLRIIGRALGQAERARALVDDWHDRIAQLRRQAPDQRPRVVCVEWLDPLYLAGHWVPELVEIAGGLDVGAVAGSKSLRRGWAEVVGLRPELVVMMLCGFSEERANTEWAAYARANPVTVALLGSVPVRFVDGNALTSRPGPRLVEGADAIHRLLFG